MNPEEEIFANADDIDINFDVDPLAAEPSPPPVQQPTLKNEEKENLSPSEKDDILAQLTTLKALAEKLEEQITKNKVQSLPSQAEGFTPDLPTEKWSGPQTIETPVQNVPVQDHSGFGEPPEITLETTNEFESQQAFDDPFAEIEENTTIQPDFKQPIEPSFEQSSQPDFGQPKEFDFETSEPTVGQSPDFTQSSEPDFGQPEFNQSSEPDFSQPVPNFGDTPDFSQPDFTQSSEPDFGQSSQPTFDQPSQPDFGNFSQPDFGQPVPEPIVERFDNVNTGLPDPYASVDKSVSHSPLDNFIAQDILSVVASQGGKDKFTETKQAEALMNLRTKSKNIRKQDQRKFSTIGKGGEPKLARILTQFRPGDPLMISVTSPKGGVGKSTTAANLAAYFAKAAEKSGIPDLKVLLVDGDVANGNLAFRLTRDIQPNLIDVLSHMDEMAEHQTPLDNYERDMKPWILKHDKVPNLDILAAPENPDVIDQIEEEDLYTLRDMFTRFYQIVIFDTGTQIVEHTNVAWLNFSDQIYFMVEPEIACLQVTAEYARRARQKNLITADLCRLVMIRANMEIEGLDPKAISQELFSFIPPDRFFFISDFHRDGIQTGNAGEFLVFDSSDYAAALTPIVQSALEHYENSAP